MNSVRIFSYSRCSTCRKALNWLSDHNIEFELVDIIDSPPDEEILRAAYRQLGVRRMLFNTSGISYRQHGAENIKAMSDDEAFKALASDGKLIKRPFLVFQENKVLVGFKPDQWAIELL